MAEKKYRNRIETLRNRMREEGICLYLIPMNDDHGSEYIAEYFKLIPYFCGFTGSAGTLVISLEEQLLWTDGRYFLQASDELKKSDTKLMKMGQEGVKTVAQYINSYLDGRKEENQDLKIGFDGTLVSYSYMDTLKKSFGDKEVILCCQKDLAGQIWQQDEKDKRPDLLQKPIWILEECFSGVDAKEKLSNVRQKMEEEKQEILVLSALDEIAWLTNLRGNDIAYNPVFYSYMLISQSKAYVYLMQVDATVQDYLEENHITVLPYTKIYDDLKGIKNKKIWVDQRSAHYLLCEQILQQNQVKIEATPIYEMKAIKNAVEIENMKQAHRMDGVAVTKFIYWLKTRVRTGLEAATERSAAQKLISLRKQQKGYLEESFAPIMAYKEHGAIVHYEADEETDAQLGAESFLLSDTGGHYQLGTTDITRTIVMGDISQEAKKHYSAVLAGHLRLLFATFKSGMQGCHLDLLAREPLYEMGLDYNHGTGHGVGYLLNVHEGPNAFRPKPERTNVIKAGMITSDEPGVYLAGEYGIRLENLILCVEKQKTEYGRFMGFEPLTMVPFDIEAIDEDGFSKDDKMRLNAYHKMVWNNISPYLSEEEKEWLSKQVRPLL